MRALFFCLAGLTHLVAALVIMHETRDYGFALTQCLGGLIYVGIGLFTETYHD